MTLIASDDAPSIAVNKLRLPPPMSITSNSCPASKSPRVPQVKYAASSSPEITRTFSPKLPAPAIEHLAIIVGVPERAGSHRHDFLDTQARASHHVLPQHRRASVLARRADPASFIHALPQPVISRYRPTRKLPASPPLCDQAKIVLVPMSIRRNGGSWRRDPCSGRARSAKSRLALP